MALHSPGGGAGTGLPVVGGLNNSALFVNPAGTLAQDNANFTYTIGTGTLTLGAATAGTLAIGSGTTTNAGFTLGSALSVAGSVSGYGYIWATGSGAPSSTNYSLRFNGFANIINSATSVQLAIANTSVAICNSTAFGPVTNAQIDLGVASIGWKRFYVDFTNTGTVGNVTINKAAGRVNLGAGNTTLTLTNSLITAASHIFLNSDGAPGNVVAVQFYAVASAGSCTINAVPAITNQTAIDFFVVNAD